MDGKGKGLGNCELGSWGGRYWERGKETIRNYRHMRTHMTADFHIDGFTNSAQLLTLNSRSRLSAPESMPRSPSPRRPSSVRTVALAAPTA